jgi:hydrogenase nickel incorporation protein HypA/HybF
MHEVSLMKNLLDVVVNTAEKEGAKSIDLIHLRIGEISGVNIDSLRFAFEILSRETVAAGAKLECEKVLLAGRCMDCGEDFRPNDLVFRCPSCGSVSIEISAGREMEVDYILLDNENRNESSG